MEMAHACRLAGAEVVEIVHLSELLCGEKRLEDYDFLNLPGGFLDGDDLGSAKAGANRILHAKTRVREAGAANAAARLYDQFSRFIDDGKLVLGVCNGFQLLVKLGVLPDFDADRAQTVTLTFNDSGRFEDRWVHLKVDPASPCVFTQGLAGLYLPVRHGEGKFIPADAETRARLHRDHRVVLRYSTADYATATPDYPANPNGSIDAVAGICSASGRIFGLMPHPEAYLHRTNHPRWTREDLPEDGMGLDLFRNAVSFARRHL